MKSYKFLIIFCLMSIGAFAQNDVQFTHFMFNKMGYNPAFAGSNEAMTLGAIYREQWVNIEGAPRSINAHAHTPFFNDRAGIGLSLTSDKIGLMSTNAVELSYAYRMKMGDEQTLAIGMSGRLEHANADWSLAKGIDPQDAMLPFGETNVILPNFGLGVVYSGADYYFGASIPQLLNNSAYQNADVPAESDFDMRTLYLMGGAEFELTSKIKFLPTALVSYNRNAPVDLDLNAGFSFMDLIYAGVSYRLEDSFDVLFQFQMTKQFRIGAAYDFTVSGLQGKTSGSFEFMGSYVFNYDKEKIRNLRFF